MNVSGLVMVASVEKKQNEAVSHKPVYCVCCCVDAEGSFDAAPSCYQCAVYYA